MRGEPFHPVRNDAPMGFLTGSGKRRRRQGDRFLGFFDRIGAPLMTLRTVSHPFFRFSSAGGAKEGEVGGTAQFKSLFKFLSGATKVFFVEVGLCEKPVKGREILYL